jgi:NitT/TauT family transport system permease protein
VAIVATVIGVWGAVSASGFFNESVLSSPAQVWRSLIEMVADGRIPEAVGKSLARLAVGFGVAIVLGTLTGLAMAGSRFIQRSVGSLIAGLQSLPSISWLPLAILWFGLTRGAVLFVVIIGAFPAVALATASAVRQVPPLLPRAGQTLGAKGWVLWRSVVFPAALPGYVAGLQQGWAFAWRSLMAGELIATGSLGLGQLLQISANQLDSSELLAVMVVIVLIGMTVEMALFGTVDRRIRSRRGLLAVA